MLYYAFPVLALLVSDDTGWPMPTVTGAFTLSLITAALVGIPVGRILDRHGPWLIMSGGSALAAVAVIAIATASNLGWFIAAWLLSGVSIAGTLYPPAFAALTRWFRDGRIEALTVLTLAAGLASTVFAPLTDAAAMRHETQTARLFAN